MVKEVRAIPAGRPKEASRKGHWFPGATTLQPEVGEGQGGSWPWTFEGDGKRRA